jgi:hypothetical protein
VARYDREQVIAEVTDWDGADPMRDVRITPWNGAGG